MYSFILDFVFHSTKRQFHLGMFIDKTEKKTTSVKLFFFSLVFGILAAVKGKMQSSQFSSISPKILLIKGPYHCNWAFCYLLQNTKIL